MPDYITNNVINDECCKSKSPHECSEYKCCKSPHIYECCKSSNVTDWNGTLLNPLARNEVTVGDSVRVQIMTKSSRSAMYIKIDKVSGEELSGKIDDPYICGYRGPDGHWLDDGLRITFKRNNISEIPDWTTNCEKIIEKYIDPDKSRGITGCFNPEGGTEDKGRKFGLEVASGLGLIDNSKEIIDD